MQMIISLSLTNYKFGICVHCLMGFGPLSCIVTVMTDAMKKTTNYF
jgi:hypothetical protein